jgi:hypothetical protein
MSFMQTIFLLNNHRSAIGIAVILLPLAVGIVLFFIVEKIVRYVEDNSQNGAHSLGHGHHHHHHKRHESSGEAKADHEGKNMNKEGGESSLDGAKLNDETGHESKATIRKVYLTPVGNLDPKLSNMFSQVFIPKSLHDCSIFIILCATHFLLFFVPLIYLLRMLVYDI